MPFDRKLAEASMVEVLDGLAGERVVGLGFKLLDGVVATACRCLPRRAGTLALPDPDLPAGPAVLVRLRRPGTQQIALAAVLAADPCADYALLSAAEAGPAGSPGPALTLGALLAGLPRALLDPAPPAEGQVLVFTHERRWVEGMVRDAAISIWRTSDQLRGATSGAPVFGLDGRVVGLVGHNDVRLPSARMCALADQLPAWALRRARQAEARPGGAAAPPVA